VRGAARIDVKIGVHCECPESLVAAARARALESGVVEPEVGEQRVDGHTGVALREAEASVDVESRIVEPSRQWVHWRSGADPDDSRWLEFRAAEVAPLAESGNSPEKSEDDEPSHGS